MTDVDEWKSHDITYISQQQRQRTWTPLPAFPVRETETTTTNHTTVITPLPASPEVPVTEHWIRTIFREMLVEMMAVIREEIRRGGASEPATNDGQQPGTFRDLVHPVRDRVRPGQPPNAANSWGELLQELRDGPIPDELDWMERWIEENQDIHEFVRVTMGHLYTPDELIRVGVSNRPGVLLLTDERRIFLQRMLAAHSLRWPATDRIIKTFPEAMRLISGCVTNAKRRYKRTQARAARIDAQRDDAQRRTTGRRATGRRM